MHSVLIVASSGCHCLLYHEHQNLYVSRDKNLRDLKQGNEQAMLVHVALSIVLETCCSRMSEMKKENVVEHLHA